MPAQRKAKLAPGGDDIWLIFLYSLVYSLSVDLTPTCLNEPSMPNPISLDTFRHLAIAGTNAEIRLGSQDEVTTAPRRLGGRLIQRLLTGIERQGRQHIATEFLRGLEAEYGRDMARQAFSSVRSDLRSGAHADEFMIDAKPLTARQVRAILQGAEGLRNERQVAGLRELTARYHAQARVVQDLAARRHVPLHNMTPAHWQVFSQLLAERLAEERVLTGEVPSTQEADRLAGKLLAHLSGLSEDELLAGVESRQRMRSQGQDLLMALAGRLPARQPQGAGAVANTAADPAATQLQAFLNVTRSDNPLTRDLVADSQAELGKDGRKALDRMALNLTINSLTPAFAGELLAALKAPGSDFRHLYAALNLLPNAPGATQREGYVAACGEIGDLLDNVLSNLARRAGEDPAATAASFQSLADHAREADWNQVAQGAGFAAAQMKADGLAGMRQVRDQVEQLSGLMAEQAQRLANTADQEIEETERMRRQMRAELSESLGNALWELSQAGNDTAIVRGEGKVTPQIQATLQEAGSELLNNPQTDLAEVVTSLRRAGVVHGRGALENFDLSYQALQDLTPFEQREQPLVLNHLRSQATLLHPDPRVAESLLKEYMVVAYNWADLHPESTDLNISAKAKALHSELASTRTGTDRNPDFRKVIEAFDRARIRMDREEFRPMTARLLTLFAQA